MNENHNHDKALEDAIERLVHGKKASGNELLDMLGAAKPKADSEFMNNLEDRLMAEFSSKEKGIKMDKRKEKPGKFVRWPLTMAAAVMAIIVVGGLLFFIQAKNDDAASGIVMNPVTAVVAVQAMIPGTVIEADMVELRTFTPDADLDQIMLITNVDLVIGRMAQTYVSVGEPLLVTQITDEMNRAFVPVVVAVQDIPEGTVIRPDRVTVMLFPVDSVPSGAFVDVDDVVGYVAATDIYFEEIILVRKLLEQDSVYVLEMTPSTEIPMVPVVIAIRDIREGTEITPDMVDTIFFPAANAPSGAFVEVEDVIGSFARTTIYTEEIILVRKLSDAPPTAAPIVLTANAANAMATAQAGTSCGLGDWNLYRVEEGDTIFSIAIEHDVTPRQIVEANCWSGVTNITAGEFIRIPVSEIDDFSLTATAIVATATASAGGGDFNEPVRVVPNVEEALGCNNDNARILYPINGQVIDGTTEIWVIANNESFERSTLEISGVSTNEAFIVLHSISQPVFVESAIGEFVPAGYEAGQYKLRLNTFNERGNQVGTCTITIFISDEATNSSEDALRPVVIAVQDIPMNTVITENMVMLSYWPDAVAMQFAMDNNGQWYMSELEGVVGMMSSDYIPAFEPISSNLLMRNACEDSEVCTILPMDRVAIALRNSDDSIQNLSIGQSVDVIASFNYRQTSDNTFQITNSGELTMQRLISDAQVIWIGGNPPDFWNVEPDAALLADERLIVVAVTAGDAMLLSWVTEAQVPILVVPAIEGAEPVELEQSSEVQIPENYLSMNIWLDASAMAFNTGDRVDVFGTFTYMNAEGQIEGTISQRMAVDYIVLESVAGTGDMARLVEVTLAAPIGGTEFLNSSSSSTGYTVFESWTLLPHNPDYVDVPRYLPMLDADIEPPYFAAIPMSQIQSLSGGFNEGDFVRLTLMNNNEYLEGEIAFFGAATYAPFAMQLSVESYRMANPRVLIMEFDTAEEVATLVNYAATGETAMLDVVR